MPSNQTPNYGLSQWARSDQVRMEDFNADNGKIDASLSELAGTAEEHAAALAAHTGQIAKLGNCTVCTGTYIGSGDYQSEPLNFPGKPMFLMVRSGGAYGMLAIGGFSKAFSIEADRASAFQMTWGERSVSWYGEVSYAKALNDKGSTYYYMALLAMDA